MPSACKTFILTLSACQTELELSFYWHYRVLFQGWCAYSSILVYVFCLSECKRYLKMKLCILVNKKRLVFLCMCMQRIYFGISMFYPFVLIIERAWLLFWSHLCWLNIWWDYDVIEMVFWLSTRNYENEWAVWIHW